MQIKRGTVIVVLFLSDQKEMTVRWGESGGRDMT